jgi:hypothetical protein
MHRSRDHPASATELHATPKLLDGEALGNRDHRASRPEAPEVGDDTFGSHREIERDRVAGTKPVTVKASGKTPHLGRKRSIALRQKLSALAAVQDRRRAAFRSETALGDVEACPGEPGHLPRAARSIEDGIGVPMKYDAEPSEDECPEPLELGDREAVQVRERFDSQLVHEGAEIGMAARRFVRLPHGVPSYHGTSFGLTERTNWIMLRPAVILAEPLRPSPAEGPREAKGSIFPDRHSRRLRVAGLRFAGERSPGFDRRRR